MRLIKKVLTRIRSWPARRVEHALACPECGHSTLEASPECACWDPGCLCVILHEERRSVDSE